MSTSSSKRLRGVSVYRPLIYGNTAILLSPSERGDNDHTHRWTVGVRSATSAPIPVRGDPARAIGGADDLSYFIKKVTFKLHETYSQPLRTIERPPFEVTETGWGEFDIIIKIFFVPESGEKPLTFNHHLKLHPWPLDLNSLPHPPAPPPTTTNTTTGAIADAINAEANTNAASPAPAPGDPLAPNPSPSADPSADPPAIVLSPVHSWQYEEIIFLEPYETFYSILLSRPPAPLPRANRHPKTLVHALGGGGNIGEFSGEMEAQEGNRLEEKKMEVMRECEEMRKKLQGQESELVGLKKEVETIQAEQAAAAASAAAAAAATTTAT